jgi:Icc-related predicted phosphoesterase
VQPLYLFCGHIHECAGRSDQIGRTQCFNVGKAGYTLEVE